MKKYIITVQKQSKVLKLLQKSLDCYSYFEIEKALNNKDVIVDGKRINKNIEVVAGQIVEVYLNLPKPRFEIFFENEDIIIFNKFKGIEVCDGEFNILNTCNIPGLYPLHRLDRNTTGLVVFAKNKQIYENLLNQFKNHNVAKFYYALVFGTNLKNQDILKSYLVKDKNESVVKIYDKEQPNSSEITTQYQVLKTGENTSLLQVKITSGKTHQIRAHLAHFKMFIVGDEKYGDNELNKKFKTKTQQLLAYKIVFNLPSTNKLSYLNDMNFELQNNLTLL